MCLSRLPVMHGCARLRKSAPGLSQHLHQDCPNICARTVPTSAPGLATASSAGTRQAAPSTSAAPVTCMQASFGETLYQYHRQYTSRREQRAEELNTARVCGACVAGVPYYTVGIPANMGCGN